MPCLRISFVLVLTALLPALTRGQELRPQRTSSAVWLDFKALSSSTPPKLALPRWLESLESDATEGVGGGIVKTTYRMRFFRAIDDRALDGTATGNDTDSGHDGFELVKGSGVKGGGKARQGDSPGCA